MVTGTGPLGCVPAELASSGSANGECAPEAQQAAAIFNPLLDQMLQGLNRKVGSDVFIGANAFNMNADFINNPQRFGEYSYNGFEIRNCMPLLLMKLRLIFIIVSVSNNKKKSSLCYSASLYFLPLLFLLMAKNYFSDLI